MPLRASVGRSAGRHGKTGTVVPTVLFPASERLVFDAAFDESEHPRDRDGRFAPKGSAAGSKASERATPTPGASAPATAAAAPKSVRFPRRMPVPEIFQDGNTTPLDDATALLRSNALARGVKPTGYFEPERTFLQRDEWPRGVGPTLQDGIDYLRTVPVHPAWNAHEELLMWSPTGQPLLHDVGDRSSCGGAMSMPDEAVGMHSHPSGVGPSPQDIGLMIEQGWAASYVVTQQGVWSVTLGEGKTTADLWDIQWETDGGHTLQVLREGNMAEMKLYDDVGITDGRDFARYFHDPAHLAELQAIRDQSYRRIERASKGVLKFSYRPHPDTHLEMHPPLLMFDAAFDEAEHPRDKDGKFAPKGGAAGGRVIPTHGVGPAGKTEEDVRASVRAALQLVGNPRGTGGIRAMFLHTVEGDHGTRWTANAERADDRFLQSLDGGEHPTVYQVGSATASERNKENAVEMIATRMGDFRQYDHLHPERGVPVAETYIYAWHAGVNEGYAKELQQYVASVTGTQYTPPDIRDDYGSGEVWDQDVADQAGAFARATYAVTQEMLAGLGYKPDDEVTLYRGVAMPGFDDPGVGFAAVTRDAYARYRASGGTWVTDLDPASEAFDAAMEEQARKDPLLIPAFNAAAAEASQALSAKAGDPVKVRENPLASWSVSPMTAAAFAASRASTNGGGYVIRANIKVRDIFATAVTGPGCTDEGEVLVIGGRAIRPSVAISSQFLPQWSLVEIPRGMIAREGDPNTRLIYTSRIGWHIDPRILPNRRAAGNG